MRGFLTGLMLFTPVFAAVAQDADNVVWAEIDKNCREWAALDGIEPAELENYLAECRSLEAQQYGLGSDPTEEGNPDATILQPEADEQ